MQTLFLALFGVAIHAFASASPSPTSVVSLLVSSGHKPGISRIPTAPPRQGDKRKQAKQKKTKVVKRPAKKNTVSTTKTVRKRTAVVAAAPKNPRKPLSGTVYYLASGHGGPDPGALGRYGKYLLPEDEYAYDVTIRLSEYLKQLGATVYMIIKDPNDGIRNEAVLKLDHDEVAYPNQRIPLNHVARLSQTTTAVNRLHAKHKGAYQRFITIHVDSRSKGQNIDVFFYHHEQNAAGKRLAYHIHKRFTANYRRHQPDRPYSGNVTPRGSLYVVRNSHPPTVFIELGNIQSAQDQKRFLIADNRQALANWLAQGILDDYRSRK
ncbi:N-acetylmuramoyl-L-alanine amidase [Spirosoma sp. KUDC1026]|uniref:N-acetylmuramoyl-L-alanine amidase n=1 Tax=Spirosoma sp. KUDC1026 TaxID=2745947 RepID=UPI001E503EFD|nr:N-acetylmuramoyl-L-alanine amidase [Spirosoma sp. KUDC1026]